MRLCRVLCTSALFGLATVVPASADVGVAAGNAHVLVLTDQGTVWGWGADPYGQLGQGLTTSYRLVAVQIPVSNVIAVAAGDYSSYALTSDGHVWAWGQNTYGQLGNGSNQQSTTPVQVSNLSGVVAIAAGASFALALKDDGTVWAWGDGSAGQIGDGFNAQRTAPVAVNALGSTVIAIDATGGHAHAVKSDGTVWSWGANSYYQLGDGSSTGRNTPVRTIDSASAMVGATRVSGGMWNAFALTGTVGLWGWGYNLYWQLADGTNTSRSRPVPSTFIGAVDVQGGSLHSVARKSDGSVWTWGINSNGQLGDGTTTLRATPAQVAGVEAAAIASGGDFVVAVSADGRVWSWGNNNSGQLGDGTRTNRLSPVQISDAGFAWRVATPALSYASGTYNYSLSVTVTCATAGATIRYTSDGIDPTETSPIVTSGATVAIAQNATLKARAWKPGSGTSNLAEATYTFVPYAPYFSPGGGNYTTAKTVTIASSTAGAELRYTLDGSTPSASSLLYTAPLQISTGTTLKAIARKTGWSDSTVTSATYTFNYGTLTAPVFSPAPGEYPYGQGVTIAAQAGATIRYTTDGSQVTSSSPIYTAPVVLTGTRTISAKAFHPDWATSAATTGTYTVRVATPRFTPDGGTYAAGQLVTIDDDTFGAVVHYTTNGGDPTESDPVIAGGTSLVACSCTLKARAFLAGWTSSDVKSSTYVMTGRLNDGVVVGGSSHSAALSYDGSVWTWGANSSRQLGNGTESERRVPGRVNGLTGVKALASGGSHLLAVTDDGAVWAWGANFSGQIGIGSTGQWSAVTRLTSLDNVVAVAGGADFSIALKSDGTVWTWGANGYGQLGDGTQNPRSAPGQVPGITDATAIAAGSNHALVLRTDGTVWGWGYNGGTLGDGTSTNRFSPVQTSVISNVVRIAAGYNQSFAIDASGVTWAWGWGTAGQLGIGSTASPTIPQQTLFSSLQALATGSEHSVAVTAEGYVWTTGRDWMGQLGNDPLASPQQNTPIAVAGLSNISGVAAGWGQSVALGTDGSVWAWGENGSGQLGDGTSDDRYVPVQIAEAGFAWKVSTPVPTPPAGAYSVDTTVTLTTVTAGTTIHYTTNGTDPTTADPSMPSGGTVLVDRTLTLKAIAVKDGMPSSNIAAAAYAMNLSAPAFSPAAGTYSTSLNVSLQCASGGAEIRYTTDGSDPTASSPLYTAPLAIDVSTTVKARAFRSGWTDSPIAAGAFVLAASVPTFTPGSGSYASGTSVSVATATPGATIRYTLDGTEPTDASALYSGPIPVNTTQTMKARAYRSGWTPSASGAASYWVTEGVVATPTVSPAGGAYAGTVMIAMSCETPQATIRYTLDGRDPDATSPTYRWPILINTSLTIKARAFRPNFTPSTVRTETYAIDAIDAVATPVIQPAGGRFATWQRVTIASPTPGASLHYTTDGSDPTETDPVVSVGGTLDVMRAMPLKVRAFKEGLTASAVRRADFVVTGAVAAGSATSYALKADGTVWSWGDNSMSQTGTGTSSLVPLQVPGLSDIAQIAAGWYHAMALARDGSLWVWGRNGYGQLGVGDKNTRASPTRVTAIANIVAVAAGESHTLALTSDGALWAWGANDKGQLGDGTATEHLTPTRVVGLTNVRAIASGKEFSLALQDDGGSGGTLWAWGDNLYGQVGDGSTLNRVVPVKIAGLPALVAVDAGDNFAHALAADGSVLGWGYNVSGQVGDTTLVNRRAPVRLPMLTGMRAISDGLAFHATAIGSRGEVWTWGANNDYLLGGTDNGALRAYPLWVTGVRDVLSLAAGNSHTLLILADGRVQAWGGNAAGQLGDGTNVAKPLPVTVQGLTLVDNAWLASDSDEDGIPAWREYDLGTDPLDADTNDDGIPDGLSADSALESPNPDSDGDGLSNETEAALGTNPFLVDTDGDGVADRLDKFPLDPARSDVPPPNPLDTTPPVITLTEPVSARPIP